MEYLPVVFTYVISKLHYVVICSADVLSEIKTKLHGDHYEQRCAQLISNDEIRIVLNKIIICANLLFPKDQLDQSNQG